MYQSHLAPGGNQRSMLAVYGSDAQSLELELEIKAEQETSLGDPEITWGQPLIVDVVFKNEDIGAITLFMRDGLESVGLVVMWRGYSSRSSQSTAKCHFPNSQSPALNNQADSNLTICTCWKLTVNVV